MRLRRALWARGLRYRLHAPTPAGKPDIVFPGPKVAVFVDGCQWHGCPEHYVRPRTRADFWSAKLAGNVERDRRQTVQLESMGWRVIRIWEHQVFEELVEAVSQVEAAVTDRTWVPTAALRVILVESLTEDGNLELRRLVSLRDQTVHDEALRVRTTRKWSRK